MKKDIISSKAPTFSEKLRELMEFKDLFYAFVNKDLTVKYAQTYLGFFWAVLQPLASILILTFVFGKVLNVDTKGIPYPLFITVGISIWNYFSIVMQQSGSSILNAQNMVQKIYFPRLILPLSKAFVGIIDLAVSLSFIAIGMVFYQFSPSSNLLYFPIAIVWLIITALGAGIWISCLTVKYRDFLYILPFVVQFGLYASPIGYCLDTLSSDYLYLFYLNPLTGILEMARWSVLGIGTVSNYSLISGLVSIVLFVSSIRFFGRTEADMADLL